MITMGDEYGKTKQGNNNTWRQDNSLSWFDWHRLQNEASLFEFCAKLIALRKEVPELRSKVHLTENEITWHTPSWDQNVVAFELGPLFIAFNATHQSARLNLPDGPWHTLVNTANLEEAPSLAPYSSIILKKLT